MYRKHWYHAGLACLAMGLAAATAPGAEKNKSDYTACQDTTQIKWFLPGQFAEARKEAQAAKRLIMIKGIAFGIDEAGAKCATKGCW